MGDNGWLVNSLRAGMGEMRQAANRCRRSYRYVPMREPADELAKAYDDAADVFRRALRAVESRAPAAPPKTETGRP